MFLRKILGSFILTSVVAGLLLAVTTGEVRAQITGTGGTTVTTGTGGSTGTSALSSSDFILAVSQQPPVVLSTFEQARFFNKGRCDCSEPINIFISLLASGVAKRNQITQQTGNVQVVLGVGCSTTVNQQLANCLPVPGGSEEVLTFLNQGQFIIPTDARFLSSYLNGSQLIDGGVSVNNCEVPATIGQFNQTVNVNFDFDGDGNVDLNLTTTLLIDLSPPPAPTGVRIQGGNEALVINWDSIDTALVPDLQGYQILCSRADQYQVFNIGYAPDGGLGTNGGPFGSAFLTCPKARTGMGVEGLDPTFVCSGLLTPQTSSTRVEILQNDIAYAAAVVAVDNSGNPSPVIIGPTAANGNCGSVNGCYGTPIKTLSFYDVYRNQTPQGQATGGFCALPTARPRLASTLGGLALAALGALGLAITRRRRGPR
jgi:hypothetical protein